MTPAISAVIPTYNRKQFVLDAINSALQQDPKNYEIIVVDDGSTDGTFEYLLSLNLPIRVIRKQNGGVASARNEGIRNAKGKYITFLDSDDVWLPGILKAQLDFLASHPHIPLVYTDQYIELSGKRLEKTRFQAQPATHEEKSRFDLSSAVLKHTPIHASSVMVRRSVFDAVGLFNEELKIHEDTEMWNRISEKYELGYIEKPLSIFRWEKDSEHLLKPEYRRLFISEAKKFLRMYQERRKQKGLTFEEKRTLDESEKRIHELERLIDLRESGAITEEEFQKRRGEIYSRK